jgi:hypothetical protein
MSMNVSFYFPIETLLISIKLRSRRKTRLALAVKRIRAINWLRASIVGLKTYIRSNVVRSFLLR